MTQASQRVVLVNQPQNAPEPGDFALAPLELPEPGTGELLLEVLYLSLDPYMGSALKGRHMSGAVQPGDTMPGETVARVRTSRHPDYAVGDVVLCRAGWQTHALARPPAPGLEGMEAALAPGAWKVTPPADAPLSALLGVLGMPGLTAYAGLTTILRPLTGETFVVSSASGAVGATAGQLARETGARVVGIAGGPAKCAHVVERFRFDACVDRLAPNWPRALAAACPDGIDAYLDCAGGSVLAAVLGRLAPRARIALVGMMEQYNSATVLPGQNLAPVLARRATVTGLVVYDHWAQMETWREKGASLIASDRLRYTEDRVVGLAAAPEAFSRLMRGGNFGKTVVEVAG